jgi:hypothetical protein
MARLKDQLDQAGYDTSTFDEAAVIKQLNDAGYDTSVFSQEPQGVMGAVGAALKTARPLGPTTEDLKQVTDASGKLGTMVEAGGAGLADFVPYAYKKTQQTLNTAADAIAGPAHRAKPNPSLSGTTMQAGRDVSNVMAGVSPETTAGKVGKTVGSFFTPNQIILQALGAKAAPLIASGAVKGVGKVANAVGRFLAPESEVAIPAGQKLASEVLGPLTSVEPEALQQVMANAPAVKAAASYPQLAEQVAGAMTKLDSHIGDLNKVVEGTLDANKMMSTEPMINAIQKAKELAGTTGSVESEAVIENLNRLQDNILKRYGKTISEVDVHRWIQGIQGETKFPGVSAVESAMNAAKKRAGGIVNDALKAANKEYAAAKGPLADAIGLKDNLAKSMGVEKAAGEPWSIKNVTVSKLRSLLNPENVAQTQKLLQELSGVPGVPDFTQAVKQTAAKAAIGARAPIGYRVATMGLGGRLPALGGTLAGLVPQAGKAAANTLDFGVKAIPAAANAVYQGLGQ